MKKYVAIGVAVILVVLAGVYFWKNTDISKRYNPDISITYPQQDESVRANDQGLVIVRGTAKPGNSVYIFKKNESCVTMASRPLAGGGVDEQGNFSVFIPGLAPGKVDIQVLSVSAEDEQAHRDICYPSSQFGKPISFTLSP